MHTQTAIVFYEYVTLKCTHTL